MFAKQNIKIIALFSLHEILGKIDVGSELQSFSFWELW